MNQNEQNLESFINLLKTSMNDVGSFRKADVSTYFLMLRKFFKNYINENNEIYDSNSKLHIGADEAENLNYFFNNMINIFENSKSDGYLHELTAVNTEALKELAKLQSHQMNDILHSQKAQTELIQAHNDKVEKFLSEFIGNK